MDVENATLDTAESVISDILISERCVENLILMLDNDEMTMTNQEQDQLQPLSVSTHQKPDQLMCQDKEPVDKMPTSSRCSVKVVEDYLLNASQDSTKSTLPPPVSQQCSSGISMPLGDTSKQNFSVSGQKVKKALPHQGPVNHVSEQKVMKQIKVIHNYLNNTLKNANNFNQTDKILLRNAKQLLFSLKQQHQVMCVSLKSSFKQKNASKKSMQALKKRMNFFQNQQHKLLLLFQEHNNITKKMKMLNPDWSTETQMEIKRPSLTSSQISDNLSLLQTKTDKISNEIVTAFDNNPSESASTVYSFSVYSQSQKMKPKCPKISTLKQVKHQDYSTLSETQEPTYESFKISNKNINHSKNSTPHDSHIDYEANQTCPNNTLSQTCPDNLISKSSICSANVSNDFSSRPLPQMLTDHQQFTAIPIGTKTDVACTQYAKTISHTQQSFNKQSVVTYARQELQNPETANQELQNILIPSGDGLSCPLPMSANAAESLKPHETVESQKEISIINSNNSIDENNLNLVTLDDTNNGIATSITRLTLIEDQELLPLNCIIPSCQDTDPFGSINFPKFLWDGFYNWP